LKPALSDAGDATIVVYSNARPPRGRRAPRRWSSPSADGDVDAADLLVRVAGPQFCFWLMIVSIAIVVLPVERSPMMSWRWPRPTGSSRRSP
jgi:hypothetical protein